MYLPAAALRDEKRQFAEKKTRLELDLQELREKKKANAKKKTSLLADIKAVAVDVSTVQARQVPCAPHSGHFISQFS